MTSRQKALEKLMHKYKEDKIRNGGSVRSKSLMSALHKARLNHKKRPEIKKSEVSHATPYKKLSIEEYEAKYK